MKGLLPILGLIFITLKLTGYIAWSWVWVLAPFWIGLAIVLVIIVVALLALSAGGVFSEPKVFPSRFV